MYPPPEAEALCKQIVRQIEGSPKKPAAIMASPRFQAKMAELEALGIHDAWRRQINKLLGIPNDRR